ncbi:hypothetical protein PR048_022888 [Dryococelus australis]|uniref:Uncharacterized protein n=1 Tax=Dryococelus australis TaxID=614101 RepID=A0ABQ9GSL6_9NEOP|nr:hypothetical protein PR048_022888 [Dryococelus australis]
MRMKRGEYGIKGRKEPGDTRRNPPTSGIIRHDPHFRKSGVSRPEIEPGTPHRIPGVGEASESAADVSTKRRPGVRFACRVQFRGDAKQARGRRLRGRKTSQIMVGAATNARAIVRVLADEALFNVMHHSLFQFGSAASLWSTAVVPVGGGGTLSSEPLFGHRVLLFQAASFLGTTVAERLGCSPSIRANRGQCPVGPLPDFRKWEPCRTMPLLGGFSRGSPVSLALAFRRRSILASSVAIVKPLSAAVATRLNNPTSSCAAAEDSPDSGTRWCSG